MPLIGGVDAETSASHRGPSMASRKGGPLSRRRFRRSCCLHCDATLLNSSQQVGGQPIEHVQAASHDHWRSLSQASGSSGREDMDVRMLGDGRPFVLEILNQRAAVPGQDAFDGMADRLAQSVVGVEVRRLQSVGKEKLQLIKVCF